MACRLCLAVFGLLSAMKVEVSPVQKVVQLLGEEKRKVIALDKEESETFQQVSQWCRDSRFEREASLKENKKDKAEVDATREEAVSLIQEKTAKISEVSNSLATFEKDLATAQQIRKSERQDFLANEKELAETVETLERAYSVLKKSMSNPEASTAAMLQVRGRLNVVSYALKRIVSGGSVQAAKSREALEAFLQQPDDGLSFLQQPQAKQTAYEAKSGGVMNMVEDLQDDAQKALDNAREEEMKSKHNFEMLQASLKNEIKEATTTVSDSKNVKAKAQQKKGEMETKSTSVGKAISEDNKALRDLKQECQSKAQAWEEARREHLAETEVIDKAIEILQKGTAAAESGESLLQLSARAGRHHISTSGRLISAARYLQMMGREGGSTMLSQISSRLRQAGSSSGTPFPSVIRMINDMIEKISTQMNEEAEQKAWCDTEINKSTEQKDKKTGRVDTLTNRMEQATAASQRLRNQIKKLAKQITELQTNIKKETEIRERERSEFEVAVKESSEAATACAQAIQVLREYYQSSSSEEESSSFLQTRASEGGVDGIIGLLEVAESDFSKSEADARAAEEAAVSEFKTSMQEARASIAEKTTTIKGKEAEIKQLENANTQTADDLDGEHEELEAISEYFSKVKEQCTTKVPTFEEIQARRQKEIEGLQQALDILTGPAADE